MSATLASLLLLFAGLAFLVNDARQAKRMCIAGLLVMAVGPAVESQLGSAAGSIVPIIATIISVLIGLAALGILTLGALRFAEHRRQQAQRPNLSVRRREVERHPEPFADAPPGETQQAPERDDLGLLG